MKVFRWSLLGFSALWVIGGFGVMLYVNALPAVEAVAQVAPSQPPPIPQGPSLSQQVDTIIADITSKTAELGGALKNLDQALSSRNAQVNDLNRQLQTVTTERNALKTKYEPPPKEESAKPAADATAKPAETPKN